MASYPTSVASLGTASNGNTIEAAHINDVRREIEAIEDALLNGITHLLVSTAAGNNTFIASLAGTQALSVRNTAAGTANAASFQAGNDVSAQAAIFRALSSTFTPSGSALASGLEILGQLAGGISLNANHASGDVRLYSRNTLALTLGASQAATFTGAMKSSGQPGFLATNSVADAAQADAATVDFNNEVYDELGNFASDTFTAPITGRYLLATNVRFDTGSAATTRWAAFEITGTSAGSYSVSTTTVASATDISASSGSVIVPMTAGDTAKVIIRLGSGTVTISTESWFSGRLLP